MLAVSESPTAVPPLSLTGRVWELRAAGDRQMAALMQRFGLPEVLARILAARGMEIDDLDAFLNPALKTSLPDPLHLLDMEKAAARVARAVMGRERIAVFGDYDVDGATSSALLLRYLRALGCDPAAYIPDRMKEGYGPNTDALLKLKKEGASVIITVDCGTLAYEPLTAAREAGLDVIVVDHHIGEARLPEAYAVVNPNRLDETSPHKQLAAVGVAFLLCVAVNRALRQQGYFAAGAEPDLKQWLDLVALGTVCDVVPLTGANRALVAQGLKVIAARGNAGLRAVLDTAGIDTRPGVYHVGFVIGPRINAGGRVGKSDLGVRLLATDDTAEALSLAKELEQHNAERKAIETMVLEEAQAQADRLDGAEPVLVVSGKGWHPGVIGIVAGRLKERFGKPVAVIGVEGGVGKASARSVEGFDFGAAVIAACESGLLVGGGGHAMAAGFTVEENNIAALMEFFNRRAGNTLSTVAAKKLWLDGMLSVGGATTELADTLERIGPFGAGNPHVRLAVCDAVNLNPGWTSDGQHIRTLLIDRVSNARLSAIAFRVAETKLAKVLLDTRGKAVTVAGQLKISEWNGKRGVSLVIDDIGAC